MKTGKYKVGSVYNHSYYLDLKMKVLNFNPEMHMYEILIIQCPKEMTNEPEVFPTWLKGTKKYYGYHSDWKLVHNKKSPLPGWW